MIAEDLRVAADVLERDGWTQHAPIDGAGRRCAAGALAWAVSNGVASYPSWLIGEALDRWRDAEEELRLQIDEESVMYWNDDPERTADEVVAALRAAAERQL